MGEAFGECEKLIKSARPRENEWGGVKNDVVAHTVRVGVRDETVVRPIMVKCRSEIKSNKAEVVPSFANRVMDHDEGAARCQRVTDKIEGTPINPVVGGYCRLVREGTKHVERKFSLWYEFVPKVDGERRVRASEDCDKVPLKGLYGAFSFVGPFVVWGNALVGDVGCAEV